MKRFGSLVRIIREMAFSREVFSFLFIMGWCVVVFTASILMMDRTGEFGALESIDESTDPRTWFKVTLQHVFRIGFLGDVDFENIAEGRDEIQNNVLFLYFVTITFMLTIVMLNALIAIMSNKYTEKMALVEVEMLRSRWNMMGETTLLLPILDGIMAMLPRCSCRNRVHPPSRSWNRFSDRPKYLVVATPLAEAPKAGGTAPPGAAPPPLEARPSASPGSVPFDGRTQVCELLDAHNKAISAPLRSLQSDVSHHRHAIESHSKPEWARSLERQIQAQFQKLERDMHAAVPAPPPHFAVPPPQEELEPLAPASHPPELHQTWDTLHSLENSLYRKSPP
jgi:hypothetical protein